MSVYRGVGTTGAPGAGAPPKVFTLHMHVTQLTICSCDRLLRVRHRIGTGMCHGISIYPGLNNDYWLQSQKNIRGL